MVKILDRYVVQAFLLPFSYCLAAFVILFIIGDLFEHLDDFLRLPNWPLAAVRYYILFIPSVFIFIVPIAILLSLIYSLGRLQHTNEITAMRAGGINIYRAVAPLILISFLVSVAVFFLNEFVAPRALKQSNLLKEQYEEDGFLLGRSFKDVTYFNPVTNREFYFERFNPDTASGNGVKVYERRADGQAHRRIEAEEAAWLDGAWWLFDGFIFTFPLSGPPEKQVLTKQAFDFSITTEDLTQSRKENSGLSYAELKELLERKRGFPESILRPAQVELHQKLALPLSCLIMGLIGVVFGIRVGKGNWLTGLGVSLLLGFLYYVLYTMSGAFGKEGKLAPWLAAWIGNIVFGGMGAYMLARLN
ncbi:MAG TPA: LptF/LptG family permease [bacterium]|nr:LptF/LptG family permease [bacterium]HPQ65122.1 LptF/LptG family permease [bacterium]